MQIKKESNTNDILAVINAHATQFMKLKGVVGVYQGQTNTKAPCIKIMIESNDSTIINSIPKSLNGFTVEIEVTGKIEPMESK